MKNLQLSVLLVTLSAFIILGNPQSFACGPSCWTPSNCTGIVCNECNTGFGLTTDGKCMPCPMGCDVCNVSTPNITCTSCTSGFMASNDNTRCFKCSPICGQGNCNNLPDNCTSCPPGNTLVNSSVAGSMTCNRTAGPSCMVPCLTCSGSGCATCVDGTWMPANSTNCIQCKAGCQTCGTVNGSFACLSCPVGFWLNMTVCTKNPPQCLTFDAVNNCTACNNRFYLDANSNCQPCSPPCLTCTSANTTCTACVVPLVLSGNTCIRCRSNCASCNPGNMTACLTCNPPFSYQPDNNGNCFRCLQTTCITCSSNNISQCVQCNTGFRLDNNTLQCVPCPFKCNTCINASGIISCTVCQPNNILVNGSCINCPQGCSLCSQSNPMQCITCIDGTYNNMGMCIRCPMGCDTCSNNISCLTLTSGWTVFNTPNGPGMLIPCNDMGCNRCDNNRPEMCLQCMLGFYSINNNSNCAPCPMDCVNCMNNITCLQCADRVNLVNGSCIRCIDPCYQCDPNNQTNCQICNRGWVLSASNPGLCVQCPNNCSVCDPVNNTVCVQAVPGYAVNNLGKIVKCAGGCGGECDPRNQLVCVSCPPGAENRNGTCVPCMQGCGQCQNGICFSCFDRYNFRLINGNLTCVLNCQSFCDLCTATSCTSCMMGYLLNTTTQQCYPDVTCNGTNNCSYCVRGTYRNANGTCSPCAMNCATCTPNMCLSCVRGFYMNQTNNNCTPCNANCFDCQSPTVCNACNLGWTRELADYTNNIQKPGCVACNAPCLYCTISADTCSSCGSGYRINSTLCLSGVTVHLNVKLNLDFTNFTTNGNSSDFSSAITTNSICKEKYLTITNLVSGSTVTTSAAGLAAGQDPNAVSASVISSLTSSSMGSSVLSYSVSIEDQNGNTVSSGGSSGPNVGLIVGVVIGGVAFLVIVGVIIFIVVKKSRQALVIQGNSEQHIYQLGQSDSIHFVKN